MCVHSFNGCANVCSGAAPAPLPAPLPAPAPAPLPAPAVVVEARRPQPARRRKVVLDKNIALILTLKP